MNALSRHVTLALFIVLTVAAPFLRAHAEGGANGGGGNPQGAEFADVAVKAFQRIEALQPVLKLQGRTLQTKKLTSKARSMRVEISAKPLTLRGKSVMAINYPKSGKVVVYYDGWKALAVDEQTRIAIHEVLGLAKVPDGSYETSRFLLGIREPCHSHGCDARKSSQMEAVYAYLKSGPSGDDGCMSSDELISLDKLTDDTYRAVCGNGGRMYRMILKASPKPGSDESEYSVKEIRRDK